jgi:hypothetical protein
MYVLFEGKPFCAELILEQCTAVLSICKLWGQILVRGNLLPSLAENGPEQYAVVVPQSVPHSLLNILRTSVITEKSLRKMSPTPF